MKKLNVPDEIYLGKKEYSWRADWKVNGWLSVAALISGACDIVFQHAVRQFPTGLRVMVATLPFLALLLWIRTLTRWIGGMDELHRRIISSAILFAVSATFFFVMLWHRVEKAIFVQGAPQSAGNWDIGTVAHLFLLLTFFYFLGYRIFNRRYQ